ncbi:MAG: hypothetical protein G01um101431_775 [Parcubacteria group bacterium Gr01-1014_31]|nr:MAG: hypothetical protein G01um101431_775 [Parcubacteria group bacterium Gr01-1014_31]
MGDSKIVTFTLGNRVYGLVPIFQEAETYVSDNTMVERAQELGANLDEEDGQFFMEHRAEIPAEVQRSLLVFTGWRHPSNPQSFAYMGWVGDKWYQAWYLPELVEWCKYDRLVHCIS